MSESTAESFGYRCMQKIAEAKQAKNEHGQILTMKEVAEIIDREDRARSMVVMPDSMAATPEERIYAVYPRKVGKKTALKAIAAALRGMPVADLLAKVQAYRDATDKWAASERQYIPYAATWFNRGSYFDDPKEWERGKPQTPPHDTTKGYTKF